MDRRTVLFYLSVFCIFTTYMGYLSLRNSPDVILIQREIGQFLREGPTTRKDNFLSVDDSLYDNLLVNTTHCKIPYISPFDPKTVHLFHKGEWVEDCPKIHKHWTFRKGKSVIFNETAMTEDGYKFKDIFCCYKIVTRVEQTLENYDVHADDLIQYSKCHEIRSISTEFLSEEFLMIECSNSLSLTVLYRGFHAIAQSSRSNDTLDKIQYWKNYFKMRKETEEELPPNILIIGTDTTSRLNFERNMVKTRKTLQELGAIEMLGYTKSGESTKPAFCAMFTGYSDVEIDSTCHYPRDKSSYDKCPIIWRRFSEAKYFTAQSEDWPDLTAFSNPGWVHQPTDFYLRTLMNAGHDYGLPAPLRSFTRLSTQWCIGHQTNDEVLIDYTESLMDMAQEEKLPLIALSWSGTLPHSMDHNVLQLIDDNYTHFLKRLKAKGQLENTILIFLSDHGQRYGPLRETISGWYEDKLPNFWIKLPEKYQKRFPLWQKALEINSRRLTSPFTLYWTLNYLIDTLNPIKPPLSPEVIYPESGDVLHRKFTKQHFLSPVPKNNSCDTVGVPDLFCACYKLHKVKLDDPLLIVAADNAIKNLNRELPSECAQLEVGQITGGARMEKPDKWIFVIGLISSPGKMLIEAQIDYFPESHAFATSSNVQRANQMIQKDIQCMKDKHWQLYCYCKS